MPDGYRRHIWPRVRRIMNVVPLQLQAEAARHLWDELYPGMPMHFEIDGDQHRRYLDNIAAAEGDH